MQKNKVENGFFECLKIKIIDKLSTNPAISAVIHPEYPRI
jgi:hypothetical protein